MLLSFFVYQLLLMQISIDKESRYCLLLLLALREYPKLFFYKVHFPEFCFIDFLDFKWRHEKMSEKLQSRR